jgi:hypothetical protein
MQKMCVYHKLIYMFGSSFIDSEGSFKTIARTKQERKRGKQTSSRPDGCLILLQVPAQDEDSFTVACDGEFLGKVVVSCSDGVKVSDIPILCEHDVNLETITDLIGESKVVRIRHCSIGGGINLLRCDARSHS